MVRDVPDEKRLELALIENIQRENLNPIEEATAYKRLAEEFRLTQADIAGVVGKDRALSRNYQRLLTLPAEVQADGGRRWAEHGARASPRGAPRRRRAATGRPRRAGACPVGARDRDARQELLAPAAGRHPSTPPDVHTAAAEERLKIALGTGVRIVRRPTGGRIEILFTSENELQRLYEQLTAH